MANKKRVLIIVGTVILVIVGITAVAVWQLPRFLGADAEAIAQTMPHDTAVFLELNLLNLQNDSTHQLTSAWETSFDEANIPLNQNDPSTLLNILDAPLNELTGITISEDVRPWVGLNVGLGLLPPKADSAPGWLVVTTVRDAEKAATFIEKLTANIARQEGIIIGDQLYQPEVSLDGDVLIIASDGAVLAQSLAASDGLSLADSKQFQETMAELPAERALSGYGDASVLRDWLPSEADSTGLLATSQGILPEYTAVALGGTAVEQGLQFELVGFHEPLHEAQTTWLAGQTAVSDLDNMLPQNTAVYLTGQRLDMIWQLLKGSLAGLGYTEADVAESMELFTGLFGFNPDTDLLATLSGEYAVALLPIQGGLAPVALVTHPDAAALNSQLEQLAAGVRLLGFSADQVEGIYQLADANGEPLLNVKQLEALLLIGAEETDLTAVGQSSRPLAENANYQSSWQAFPDGSLPLLFVDFSQFLTLIDNDTAVNLEPITHAALVSQSDANTSRGTLILFYKSNAGE